MPVNLKILGTTYEIPVPGESPQWGESLTAYLVALNEFLTLLVNPNDILPTDDLLLNNQPVEVLIKGLAFNSALIRSANINYTITRSTDTQTKVETGVLLLDYNADAPVNEKWSFIQNRNEDAGVILSVTDAGQFYYTSNDLTGANYSGVINFSARVLSID